MNLRTDFALENSHNKIIKFKIPDKTLQEKFIHEVKSFLKRNHFSSQSHVFVVGLGNEAYTADAVGPKAIKHIDATSHLDDLGIFSKRAKVSLLEPSVMGKTGISTEKMIACISKEIKPDLLILIDSLVTDQLDLLNHSIQINDEGMSPGSGLFGQNKKISQGSIGIPVICIGVATAIEYVDSMPLIVCTSDIDAYVANIAQLIGEGLNQLFSSF